MDDNNKSLTVDRSFDAPRDAVWQAWTDSTKLAQWWSPDMFSVPKCEIDLQPGGKMHIEMQGPDGKIYPMDAVYEEVSAPDKLIFVSSVLDEQGNMIFQVHHTITFSDDGDKTKLKLIWDVVNQTPEAKQYLDGMNEGLNQSLKKLDDFLAKQRA